MFLSFAKANKKNESRVRSAYYNVVTDALETNFSFRGLPSDFTIPELPEDIPVVNILTISMDMEQHIQDFYLKAAEQSESLLADVPVAMRRVAKSRDQRKVGIKSLLEELRRRA
jgi:hypothetical protein